MKIKIFKGDNGKYGVQEERGGVIYEADFSFKAARRIAQLENSLTPPKDWEATEDILIREGLLEANP